ncbi:hypothetical protein BN59_00301 [Legionella massiliensis]|uniref:Lipoprotein n=1 Tax=Legionella massiliensis TaxID=1034943 RepID=A0A078KSW2_9GAMM|nr:hypothetical protein [Legionella massiliensis]CDZ76037.1 hypothetical protein BN59_00301 [Legionella massiliensis]CEE11775.1 hypothetical protein BN1094_00301 [Legionella massiliensis]
MKKNALLSKLACAIVCLSPLVMTGCESMGEFFGEPNYNHQTYPHTTTSQHHAGAQSSSGSSASRAVTTTNKVTRSTSTSGVPVEAPSVHTGATSVPGTAPTVNSSGVSTTNSAVKSTSTSTTVKVPAAPSSGPTMIPPTVAQ